ncbi:MAG: hypothetical protein MK179_13965 [Pirellulaceae bacterium]|nr:hypothetical protein [Pirellulaceae bacterium]
MHLRQITTVFFLTALLWGLGTLSSNAQIKQKFKKVADAFKTDWHRVNYWPKPFSLADRRAVAQPFAIMIENGWQRQNTLGSFQFDVETHELTEAGKRQLYAILNQFPSKRRQVFVQQGESIQVTAARIDSVQRSVAQMTVDSAMPPVHPTQRGPVGVAAGVIDTVYRKYDSSIADPRLPAASAGIGDGI